MTEHQPEAIRDRTRRIAASELTVVAQDLFVAAGYEATTVEQIAAAAGMSKRTFFRYFSSKEDLVIGKYDLFGDRMADALAARPKTEPVWESLRRVFDIAVEYADDPLLRTRNDAMERIVRSTPSLYAGYLEKMSRMQNLLIAGVRQRLADTPGTDDANDVRARAIVGAAFACLIATQDAWQASDQTGSYAGLLDQAMGAFHIS